MRSFGRESGKENYRRSQCRRNAATARLSCEAEHGRTRACRDLGGMEDATQQQTIPILPHERKIPQGRTIVPQVHAEVEAKRTGQGCWGPDWKVLRDCQHGKLR